MVALATMLSSAAYARDCGPVPNTSREAFGRWIQCAFGSPPPPPTYTPPINLNPPTPSQRRSLFPPEGPSFQATLRRFGENMKAVTVTLNGTVPMSAMLDTGSTNMVLGPTTARALVASGTLDLKRDFVGMGSYMIADGSKMTRREYNLRSITIGGYTVYNVTCIGAEHDTDELIGMSLLSKFKSWTIDNTRNVLILTP